MGRIRRQLAAKTRALEKGDAKLKIMSEHGGKIRLYRTFRSHAIIHENVA